MAATAQKGSSRPCIIAALHPLTLSSPTVPPPEPDRQSRFAEIKSASLLVILCQRLTDSSGSTEGRRGAALSCLHPSHWVSSSAPCVDGHTNTLTAYMHCCPLVASPGELKSHHASVSASLLQSFPICIIFLFPRRLAPDVPDKLLWESVGASCPAHTRSDSLLMCLSV